jgi:hypothetical protein
LIHRRSFKDISQGRVNLVVRRITPLAESLNDTIESELMEEGEWVRGRGKRKRYERQYFSVDIGSLLLFVDGSGNGVLGGMLSGIFDSVGEGHVGWDVDVRERRRIDRILYATTSRENDVTFAVYTNLHSTK